MFLERKQNFQVRWQIPKLLTTNIIERHGKINFADIIGLVIKKLNTLILTPTKEIYFSLFNISCMNGNSCGYVDYKEDLPSSYLVFNFVIDKKLDTIDFNSVLDSRQIRYKIKKSKLKSINGEATVFSVGLSIKELGDQYFFFKNTIEELEVLYLLTGMATRTYKIKSDDKESKYFFDILSASPRYVIANQPYSMWQYNRYMWFDFPNLIPELDHKDTLWYLLHIHPVLKKSSIKSYNKCSEIQRTRLGRIVRVSDDSSVIDFIYQSLMEFKIRNFDSYLYDQNANKCFLAIFGNYETNLVDEAYVSSFVTDFLSDVSYEFEIKQKIHQLLWNQ